MIKKFNYVENDTHIFLLILYLFPDVCMCVCASVANSIALLNVYCFLGIFFLLRSVVSVVEFNLVLLGNATTVSEDLIFISTLFADHIYTEQ